MKEGSLMVFLGLLAFVVDRYLVKRRSGVGAEANQRSKYRTPRSMATTKKPEVLSAARALARLRKSLESCASIVVFGPTRSGKTSSLLLPILSRFDGSAVVTSVKKDLRTQSLEARRRCSKVFVISDCPVDEGCFWDPFTQATDVDRAREIAHHMTISSGEYRSASADSRFWYRLAEILVSGVLLATSSMTSEKERRAICSLEDLDALLSAVETTGSYDLAQEILSILRTDERHASSVLITVQSVLAPHLQALSALGSRVQKLDLVELMVNRERQKFTLYLSASISNQSRLAPYFGTLISYMSSLIMTEEKTTSRVLFALDELANVAPVSDLAKLASAGLSFGVRLVSVFQDYAQVKMLYGDLAGTVVNNHAVKIFFGGLTDPFTLDLFERFRKDLEDQGSASLIGLRRGAAYICEMNKGIDKVNFKARTYGDFQKIFTFAKKVTNN
jgi:type IV secretion system protein VirD4